MPMRSPRTFMADLRAGQAAGDGLKLAGWLLRVAVDGLGLGTDRAGRRHIPQARALALSAVVALAGLTGTQVARAVGADEAEPLRVTLTEPRAFGYQLGDTAAREVQIDVPRRLKLDDATLPRVGPQGPALELRSMVRTEHATGSGSRLTLKLTYQIFAAPVSVRTYELPPLKLHFDGATEGARAEDLRVDVWPLVVAAIATEEPSPRTGLGELRPDAEPPARDTFVERGLFWACGGVALLAGLYLGLVYFGLPWWGRRHRPFGLAYRHLLQAKDIDALESCRTLHAAINQTAGQVVFAESLDGFLAQAPRFGALREPMQHFFARSQAAFFGGGAAGQPIERAWILDFARACRNVERGSA
jgi:mxaA protein